MKNLCWLVLVFLLLLGCAEGNNYTAPVDPYGTKGGWGQDAACSPGCPLGMPSSW